TNLLFGSWGLHLLGASLFVQLLALRVELAFQGIDFLAHSLEFVALGIELLLERFKVALSFVGGDNDLLYIDDADLHSTRGGRCCGRCGGRGGRCALSRQTQRQCEHKSCEEACKLAIHSDLVLLRSAPGIPQKFPVAGWKRFHFLPAHQAWMPGRLGNISGADRPNYRFCAHSASNLLTERNALRKHRSAAQGVLCMFLLGDRSSDHELGSRTSSPP